jgi:hypothetical protein
MATRIFDSELGAGGERGFRRARQQEWPSPRPTNWLFIGGELFRRLFCGYLRLSA